MAGVACGGWVWQSAGMSTEYQRLFSGSHAVASVAAAGYTGVKAVTFDAGGTLIYAYPSVGQVYSDVAKRHGYEVDAADAQARFLVAFKKVAEGPRERIDLESERRTWRNIVADSLGHVVPETAMDGVFEELWHTFASARSWKLFEDAFETVSEVRRRGYRVFLLSNADSRFRQTFGELGFAAHFEEMFISAEIGCEKPSERIFRHVQESIGCQPEEILHVGDSAYHDGAAAALGWNVAILGRELSRLGDLLKLLPEEPA